MNNQKIVKKKLYMTPVSKVVHVESLMENVIIQGSMDSIPDKGVVTDAKHNSFIYEDVDEDIDW